MANADTEPCLGGPYCRFARSFTILWVLLCAPLWVAGDVTAQENTIEFADRLNNKVNPRFSFGLTLEAEQEFQNDFDLNSARDDRRHTFEPSAKLAVAYRENPNTVVAAEAQLQRSWFADRPPGVADGDVELQIDRLYLAMRSPEIGVTLTIGRIPFDDELEWIYDEKLDGFRLVAKLDSKRYLTLSASRFELFFPEDVLDSRGNDRIDNYLVKLRHREDKDNYIDLYTLLRDDTADRRPEDLYFFGAQIIGTQDSLLQKDDALKFWSNLAYVSGDDRGNTISGFGFDIMSTYVMPFIWEPSVTVGFAFGSGDASPRDGKDSNFRQTDLQDNNARFNGVTSFKYYGEVFEPELSNMFIYTLGIGLRPTKNSSLDLVYHKYLQHRADDDIRSSNLSIDPNGLSRDLGDELDLVFGYRPRDNIRLEAVLGVFFPGSAFKPTTDEAYFASSQLRITF